MRARVTLCLCLLALLSACRAYTGSTPWRALETSHAENYARVFGGEIPAGVEVVNSVVIDYAWRPLVVTTDDWEFELLAPRSWLAEQSEELSLGPVDLSVPVDRAQVERRIEHPIRPWYAPAPLADYEVLGIYTTSVMYVQMSVRRQAEPDGRHRIFASKH